MKNEIEFEDIIDLFSKETKTLQVINDVFNHEFPSSISSNNTHNVQVGHIRPDYSLDKNKGWNFWISCDQLLRGAAYNAYLITTKLTSLIETNFNQNFNFNL